MQPSPNRTWLSAHLFFESVEGLSDVYGRRCDQVLTDVAGPFARRMAKAGLISRFFLVRHGEGGPHVRLRLLGSSGRACRRLVSSLEETLASERTLHLEWIPYEPEYARYGGRPGVDAAEQLFHLTSELALDLFGEEDGLERSARLGKAALAALVLAHAFGPRRGELIQFFRFYASGYVRTLIVDPARRREMEARFTRGLERQQARVRDLFTEAWVRLEEGQPLPAPFEGLRRGLAPVRDRLFLLARENRLGPTVPEDGIGSAVSALLPSYVHMTNNRLGIAPPEEAYLAHLMAVVLDAIPAVSS